MFLDLDIRPFSSERLWKVHVVVTSMTMSWMAARGSGTPNAMQTARKGRVAANSRYSRIGATKKKPSVSSVGVIGETRWKSRMPEARAPLTDPLTWPAPMMTMRTIWRASSHPAAPPLANISSWYPAQRMQRQSITTMASDEKNAWGRSRDRTCLTRIGLSSQAGKLSQYITTAPWILP